MSEIQHISGSAGGFLVGNSHKNGGIKAINKSTGLPLEMEGEVVITKTAVDDNTKHEFEGEMLTNRQILSKINESGGGVSFADGGEIPGELYFYGNSYKYGGETLTDYEIAQKISSCGCQHNDMKGSLSEGKTIQDIAEMHDVIIEVIEAQLEKGIEVEKEHGSDEAHARRIAMDHLVENPFYYEVAEAAKLEKGGKINQKDYNLICTWAGGVEVVSDKNQTENGDYKVIAYIYSDGNIKYFEKNLPKEVLDQINVFAKKSRTNNDEAISLNISDYKNPYFLNRAIEKLLDEKKENQNFSIEEKEFISNYSGYGGLENQGDFSDEELKGLLYEYYTPEEIVKKMWALAYKYGFGLIENPFIFEPSVGTGNFLKYAPLDSTIIGNEINKYSKRICEILYPDANIKLQPFELNFIKNNQSIKNKTRELEIYDLVIGNPPYGKAQSKYISMGESDYTKSLNFTEYFISRGLDLLKPGGLLIYIVGTQQYNGGTLFLDSGITKAKTEISKKANLIDAYRLPANIFERTGVSSEILIFKKK